MNAKNDMSIDSDAYKRCKKTNSDDIYRRKTINIGLNVIATLVLTTSDITSVAN